VKYVVTVDRQPWEVEVTGVDGRYRVVVDGRAYQVDARGTTAGIQSLVVDGVSWVAGVVERDGVCLVDVDGESYAVIVEEQTRWVIRTKAGAAGGGGSRTLTAPLPGKITRVAVRPGDAVKAGDTLLVIEAMKMENEFKAGTDGTVAEVRTEVGQAVNAGDVLVVIR